MAKLSICFLCDLCVCTFLLVNSHFVLFYLLGKQNATKNPLVSCWVFGFCGSFLFFCYIFCAAVFINVKKLCGEVCSSCLQIFIQLILTSTTERISPVPECGNLLKPSHHLLFVGYLITKTILLQCPNKIFVHEYFIRGLLYLACSSAKTSSNVSRTERKP
jgi:hypothetical protein